MRVGIMCHASLGGSVHVAVELAHKLAERHHRVHLFARREPFGLSTNGHPISLHCSANNGRGHGPSPTLDMDWEPDAIEAFVTRILKVIDSEGLDVLHFHYALPFAGIAAEVRRRLGASRPRIVGTLHGTDVATYGKDPRFAGPLATQLRQADILTAVSINLSTLATAIFQLDTPPHIIPNFVDLATFKPGINHRLARGARPRPRIAHVSNFRAVKDPQSLARIFVGLRRRMDAELWLLGDGQGLTLLSSIVEESGFGADVHRWGWVSDVPRLLARADLLLMTSISESFCLAALEAMACGVPVLATRVGGLPEVVLDGDTGFLFPVGDLDRAVEMGLRLLTDADLYRNMSVAAVRWAQKFRHEVVIPRYEELYARVLNGHAVGSGT